MPISEDEFERQQPVSNTTGTSGMSKAELRRSNKPIMEKRRRARINHCLNELKTLILDAMKKDPARHSKLEKADILEMTVKHLQTIQRQQNIATASINDATVIHKFKSGFHECAGEVSRFVGSMDGVEPAVKQRLIAHLTNCVNGLSQISQFSLPQPTYPQSVPVVVPQVFSPSEVNNNENGARIQMPGGIQLIPSRLPTGELALLVPNSTNMSFFPSTTFQKPTVDSSTGFERVSAFTTVSRTRSPVGSPASSTEDHKTPSPPIYPSELSQVSSTSIEVPTELRVYPSVIKSAEKYQIWESRKRGADDAGLLMETKLRKVSEVSSSEQYSSGGFETSSSENKTDSSSENLSFSDTANTSGSSSTSGSNNEPMWRPW